MSHRKNFSLAFYLDDRYLSTEDSQFVELVQADLDNFQQSYQTDVVLLFPPVNNYLRLLIHKTVESFSQLHSFSVGEGDGRRTVVCWSQALLSPNPEYNSMSVTRPPSSRGRGRGRLRDQHSQSPAGRTEDKLPQMTMVKAAIPDQSHALDITTTKKEKKERPERKNRRPDVQVYVPRGRRLQQHQSNTSHMTRRTVSDSPDKTNNSRAQRINESPHYKNRSGVDCFGNVAGALAATVLKEQNSRQNDGWSMKIDKVECYPERESHIDFNDTEKAKTPSSTKIKSSATETNEALHRFHDAETVEAYSCNDNQTHAKGVLDNNLPSNKKISEETEKIVYNCATPKDENYTELIEEINSHSGQDNERCIKKMKVSKTSEQNSDYAINDLSSLDNDAKNCQIVDTELESRNSVDTFSYRTHTHSNNVLSSEITESEKQQEEELVPLECKSSPEKVEKDDNTNCQNKLAILEEKKTEVLNSGDISICSESISTERNNGVINESVVVEGMDSQMIIRNEESEKLRENFICDQLAVDQNKCSDDDKISTHTVCCISSESDSHISAACLMETNERDTKSMTESVPLHSDIYSGKSSVKILGVSQASNENPDSLVSECKKTEDSTERDMILKDKTNLIDQESEKYNENNESAGEAKQTNCEKTEVESEVIINDLKMGGDDDGNVIKADCDQDHARASMPYQDDEIAINGSNTTESCDTGDKTDCQLMLSDENPADKSADPTKDILLGQSEVGTKSVDYAVLSDERNQSDDNTEETTPMYQSEVGTVERNQSGEEQSDEDTWDTMFDDNGECLDPSAMEELTRTVGKVKIQKSKKINYLDYKPKDKSAELDYADYGHIIEIYGFPAEFVTRDLIMAFQAFMSRGFDLKWVDDTHALGIFASAVAAQDALNMVHPLLKVCPLPQASAQSKAKAKRCTEFLQPYKPRPETSAVAARRLVAGALGLQSKVPKEKRDKERQQLKEAKAKKRQDRQNRDDIWEGRLGRCAMDEEG